MATQTSQKPVQLVIKIYQLKKYCIKREFGYQGGIWQFLAMKRKFSIFLILVLYFELISLETIVKDVEHVVAGYL